MTPLFNRGRAACTWLAFIALLGHAVMPPGLMPAPGLLHLSGGAAKFALCGAASESDASGKAKPGLPVHSCALCTVSVAELSPPYAGLVSACETARDVHPRLGTEGAAAPLRRGQLQARAPPAMA